MYVCAYRELTKHFEFCTHTHKSTYRHTSCSCLKTRDTIQRKEFTWGAARIHIYICTYTYICLYVHTFVCTYSQFQITQASMLCAYFKFSYIHTCVCTYINIFTFIATIYLYVCMYICMYQKQILTNRLVCICSTFENRGTCHFQFYNVKDTYIWIYIHICFIFVCT